MRGFFSFLYLNLLYIDIESRVVEETDETIKWYAESVWKQASRARGLVKIEEVFLKSQFYESE